MIKNFLALMVATFFLSTPFYAEASPLPTVDNYAYALAIKGGISLGSYESGMNWFFIEKLRQQSEERKNHHNGNVLSVIAGASAGGINAVVSAIQFCQEYKKYKKGKPKKTKLAMDDNLFFKVWNVDAYSLLPEIAKNPSKKEIDPLMLMQRLGLDDTYSVFRRKALMASLTDVYSAMNKRTFRNECVTHIALPITIIRDTYANKNNKDAIVTLRYAVPLTVSVKNSQLQFDNMGKDNPKFQKVDDFLYLKENKYGHVAYANVIKLALASSAFPVAFSPIELSTCLPTVSGKCASTDYKTRTFIDGGSMDNAPIGLAKRISDYTIGEDSYSHTEVVYLNPEHKSPQFKAWIEDTNTSTGDVSLSGLQNYYVFLGKLLNYGMNAEYARSLRKDGIPLMPQRNFMLTADHLMHFGAFVSSDFRTFDFLLGVYDATKAYARYTQNLTEQPLLFWDDLLAIEDANITALFTNFDQLYAKDNTTLFCNNPNLDSYAAVGQTCDNPQQNKHLSIACALCKAAKKDSRNKSLFESFDDFKNNLPKTMREKVDENYNDFGLFRLSEILTKKQLKIEKARQNMMAKSGSWLAQQKKFTQYVSMASLMTKTLSYREKNDVWPRNTASSKYWNYLPNEFGIDGLNSAPYFSYHVDFPVKTMLTKKLASMTYLRPLSIGLSFDPYHWGRDNRKTSPYTGLIVAARYHKNGLGISSFSLGVANYYNWKPVMAGGRRWDHGMYMGMGLFADKVHLSIIQRETLQSIKKARFTFLIGIRDIGGLSELFMGD